MCGFIGTISKNTKAFPEDMLKKMGSMIVHRGPDDRGVFSHEDWLGMAFQRLSILDLSEKGHQPMISSDRKYAIVFNGEIYNYRELREELKRTGSVFISDCDTEVIIEAYRHWGRSCVEKFIGMFAFLIADLNDKTLFAARDPLGIKPLFIFEDANYLILCSEIKSLLPYCKLEPDLSALNEYLIFRTVLGEKTLFKGVRNLLPGHSLEVVNGNVCTREYFNMNTTLDVNNSRSFEEVCELTEETFKESMKLHLRSDVPLGVQLSGGVDSSLITAVAAEQTGRQLHSFSISLGDSELDESKYQKYISERYNTEHHDYLFTNKMFGEHLHKAIWHYEHPLNDPNSAAALYLSERANKHITVMLTGEGADEAFLGYSRFQKHSIANIKRRMWFYSHPAIRRTLHKLWPIAKGQKFLNITKYNPAMFALTYSDLNSVDKLLQGNCQNMDYRTSIHATAKGNTLNEAILQDQVCDLYQWFIRADRMGMASSMELRVPFCTVPMFALANSIPYSQRVYRGERKAVLKKIAEKYMDHQQIYRKKIGFGLPISEWAKSDEGYGQLLKDTFESDSFKKRPFIDQQHFNEIYASFKSGKYSERNCGFLWTYFNIENWYKIYFEDGWKELAV